MTQVTPSTQAAPEILEPRHVSGHSMAPSGTSCAARSAAVTLASATLVGVLASVAWAVRDGRLRPLPAVVIAGSVVLMLAGAIRGIRPRIVGARRHRAPSLSENAEKRTTRTRPRTRPRDEEGRSLAAAVTDVALAERNDRYAG